MDTEIIIDRFNDICDEHLYKFYPSITKRLLKKALTFSEAHLLLSDDGKAVIHHARKLLLFNDQQTWIKRDSVLSDVTMGGYDEVEVCELAGNYLLYKL